MKSSRGMYKKEDIHNLGLPLFYDYECINGNSEFQVDYWTVTELKTLLNVTLSEEEKAIENIKGFKSGPGYFGWAAVYSMSEIMNRRGFDIKYSPSGD